MSEEQEADTIMDIGAILVEARENKNLSAEDIAAQMNLTLEVITKIEKNEVEQSIPMAFVRGYIRSYAQKVNLDYETICAEFDRQTGQGADPIQKIKVVSNFNKRRKEINSSNLLFKLVTFLLVATIIVFGGWELFKKLKQTPQADELIINEIELNQMNDSSSSKLELAEKTATEFSLTSEPLVANQDVATVKDPKTLANSPVTLANSSNALDLSHSDNNNEVNTTEASNAEANNIVVETKAADVSVNEKIAIAQETSQLKLEFSGECWVQIKDALGETLAVGVKQAGKIMPLQGVKPFTIILGEPSVVSMEYDGEAYDLSGFAAGRSARFVIE